MASKAPSILANFSFYDFLWEFYYENRRKIRSRYNELTKKFLDFNDKKINPNAYLRTPQFEALEIYVFIKEFLDNKQVYEIFDDWYNRRGDFSERSYYTSMGTGAQMSMFDTSAFNHKEIFNYMRKDAATYPNYIYALTMGLGKTILMATCIFYEFLLMNKYPRDKRFCHNVLVFAPDKTVLESLREIITFDKRKVVPAEYCHILDNNINFHFLDDSGTTLNTLDGSDFNIIISNTQKIIRKRVHREKTAIEMFLDEPSRLATVESDAGLGDFVNTMYGDDTIKTEVELTSNQRFEKLARLGSLGIYVDEAHHMFGKDLQKSMSSLRLTINELANELAKKGTRVVACYNYTGTPYTENSVLPEVVYSYGLKRAIENNYLKQADIKGYENVKSETFLYEVIKEFWDTYSGKTFEGLAPKLAIFGSTIDEIVNEVRPAVERTLSELGIPLGKILVNVGDGTVTKNDDIRNFNDLDKVGTVGSEKQFILLVNKGREGWNCRSLFGVALFRSPKSTIFVLQATMRCLRQITDVQQKAMVRLSKENLDILDNELHKNFRMSIEEMKSKSESSKETFEVRIRKVKKLRLKEIRHIYSLIQKYGETPVIDFDLSDEDYLDRFKSYEYSKEGLTDQRTLKQSEVENKRDNRPYSLYTLTAEIAFYLKRQMPCKVIEDILLASKDGTDKIVEVVSKYNEVLYDRIIPYIFNALFTVECQTLVYEKEVDLLRYPEGKDFYEFNAKPDMVVNVNQPEFDKLDDSKKRILRDKSFHTDNYCFDSKPERECFWQYIMSAKVKEVYFTGMFTSKYNGLSIQYIDPETHSVRSYYPDFISILDDDTIQIVEVKGDNKIDDMVVKAKADAASELAIESKMDYRMIPGSVIMNRKVI